VLVLAPHPFFTERGTPIDVLLVMRVLAERQNLSLDVVTYNEGEEVSLADVELHRIPDLWLTRGIRPGLSVRKLIADSFFTLMAWKRMRRADYDLVHAGEESVFIALLFKRLYGIPYVYDMDSSIAQQLVEGQPLLRPFSAIFNALETTAIRQALACLPVCNALAELCERRGASRMQTLHDISQLERPDPSRSGWLVRELGLPEDCLIVLYSGNLETYQGVDLLLDGFARASHADERLHLVIVGGSPRDIRRYRKKSDRSGLAERVHFIGPRPFGDLHNLLAEADILACPRNRGINTPMKVFPYLHSGKPVIATRLYTHTQILTEEEAYLADATPEAFADGLLNLAADPELRRRLGSAGRAFVERDHTFEAHRRRLNGVYDWLESELGDGDST
jgi:glycosyltransferase involved in cell wall biosynthesis